MLIAVDTSAIITMLLREPEAKIYGETIEQNEAFISAGSVVETISVVASRLGLAALPDIWLLFSSFRIEVMQLTEPQLHLAQEGMARFGKGRGSPPAVLNFGDLFAYALARHLGAPLLFKGDDFARTDIKPALAA